MAPTRKRSKVDRARQYLSGAGVLREDSDDELGDVDYPWEWIYADEKRTEEEGQRKPGHRRKAQAPSGQSRIAGVRMNKFECRIGDAVLLKADSNEAWVALVCDFFEGEDEDGQPQKMAKFMWFATHKEARNRSKKRSDFMQNELYITPTFDDNPVASINGKARVVSRDAFFSLYPSGQVKRSSPQHGKLFVCRRGCNTRTSTYTDEFVWEDLYSGPQALGLLEAYVKKNTTATRKRKAPSKAKEADLDDFVVRDDEGDEELPKTPRKRRRLNDAATPTSRRKDQTPRKYLTPTHRRIVVKKPLEFTPLGTRILPPSALSSPFQMARSQLHVSSVPATLPCREDEFSTVYSHLEAAITDGVGSCIYISGVPGTGKTATVREVVAQLNASVQAEELDDFIFVEINGMKITDPHQAYSLLWEALRGDRVSPAHALELLEREFSSPGPRRVPCVVLMDELDQLVTKNQSVMYNFFNWPGLRHSRLIVLAVANTMDLPERTLSNKISSRLGLTRITFPGYTHDQLMQIIQSRLEGVPGNLVHPDAIQFASRKVAAVSGDARRALDICRRAVEIAEQEALSRDTESASAPNTPSKTGRNARAGVADGPSRAGTVTIATVKQAINEATRSPLQQCLRALPLASKVFLAALLARIRRTGVGEAVLGDVLDEAKRMGLMSQLDPVHNYLLTDLWGRDGSTSLSFRRDDHAKTQGSNSAVGKPSASTRGTKMMGGTVARMLGLGAAAVELAEAGIIGVEARGGQRVGRVRLGVGDEEIRLALKDDEEVKGFGFGP